ncbi:ImmA/IrrE family metallo-endopeptidase [Sporosarcina sp. FSL K6-3457]|uniref:ImmA/IrrE family metallo-endopeptidase n=1 Tax=Sporosarcina sp. FSL K6-3457 TaxID=2978204 RepID=UPI0030F9B128
MRITQENLDDIIIRNQQIKDEIKRLIVYVDTTFKEIRIQSAEKQALQILRQHYFIQIPIEDQDFGGAIKVLPNGKKLFIINTAQPRVYQYFIYWHEIYHLLENGTDSHIITLDFDMKERKADYFAAQMLLGSDLYRYFMNLSKPNDFIEKVMFCIDMFKAPFKAILIQLYESAIAEGNTSLRKEIQTHFDRRFSQDEMESYFNRLNLDLSLIQPSKILDMDIMVKAIKEKSDNYPEVNMYKEHLEKIERFIANVAKSK